MLQHKQAERTQGETQHKHIAEQISLIKLFGRGDRAENCRNQRCAANRQSSSLNPADACGRHVLLRVHFAAPCAMSFSRKSPGRSATWAFLLSCNART